MTSEPSATTGGCTVEGLEMTLLSVALDPPFSAAIRKFDQVVVILVEVRTKEGHQGTGTGFAFSTGDARIIASALAVIEEQLRGVEISLPEPVWRNLFDGFAFVGQAGPVASALGIVDIALWDVRAKAAGLPLWRMLGGARDRIRAYASAGSTVLSTTELVGELVAFASEGFGAVKIKIAANTIAADRKRLAAIRKALGPNVDIAVDANQAWTAKTAVASADRLSQFDIWWLEEPLSADRIEELARVRAAVAMPVAAGETNFAVADFERMLACGAADIIMPNVQRVGGITPWRKIAAAAELQRVPIGSHVQPEVQVHLMCAAQNGLALEYVPWWPWPFEEPLDLRSGLASPPDRPGLGLTVDKEFVRHHRIAGAG